MRAALENYSTDISKELLKHNHVRKALSVSLLITDIEHGGFMALELLKHPRIKDELHLKNHEALCKAAIRGNSEVCEAIIQLKCVA